MNRFKNLFVKIKLSLIYIYTSLPFVTRRMPVGLTEFEAFADRITKRCGSLADKDSMRFVIASQILHLPSGESNYSDQVFVKNLEKAAASQVASQVFQELKLKQQAQQAAAVTVKQETVNGEPDKVQQA